MIGRASISMRNLSFADTIENAPGIDCGLFGGESDTEPRKVRFCTWRNFSPPCAVNAARARSIGEGSGVMVTAGAGASAGGAAVVFAGGCSWANSAGARPATQTAMTRDCKNSFFIYKNLSPRSSSAPAHKCDDYRHRYYRERQTHRTRLRG